MVKTKEELLDAIKEKIGDSTEDKDLELLENITDTLSDFETKSKDTTDWEKKYKENDEAWRTKYKERFFQSDSQKDELERSKDEESENDKPLTFDNLFKPDK